MTETDRNRLVLVVQIIHRSLDQIVKLISLNLTPRQRLLVLAAWKDLQRNFQQIRSSIESRDFDQRLDAAGLSGVQLRLKEDILTRLSNLFGEQRNDRRDIRVEDAARRYRPPRWLKKLLGGLLKAINMVLGSMSVAIPFAEPIKEFKEGLEILLELPTDRELRKMQREEEAMGGR